MAGEGERERERGRERSGSTYVHDPDTFEEEPGDAAPADREFGLAGWGLVAVIVLAFIVVPALVLVNPPALPFEVAFLVLPLLPAFVLGAVAVWTAVRSARRG